MEILEKLFRMCCVSVDCMVKVWAKISLLANRYVLHLR